MSAASGGCTAHMIPIPCSTMVPFYRMPYAPPTFVQHTGSPLQAVGCSPRKNQQQQFFTGALATSHDSTTSCGDGGGAAFQDDERPTGHSQRELPHNFIAPSWERESSAPIAGGNVIKDEVVEVRGSNSAVRKRVNNIARCSSFCCGRTAISYLNLGNENDVAASGLRGTLLL